MLSMRDISRGFASEAAGYPLVKACVFGSQARGEAREDSDIDIVIDVEEGFSLFDLCGLSHALQERFGRPCDVVTRASLKDAVRADAERDEVLIYERTS